MANGKAVGVVTKKAYAEHRGCSPAYVSKLIRIGRLAPPALLPDGRVNVILADQMIGAPGGDDEAALPLAAPDSTAANYAVERAKREKHQAELAEMEVAKRRGELLARGDVDAAARSVFGRAAARILERWPDLSVRLATMTDAAAIAELLTDETKRALGAISQEFLEDVARRAA